MLKNVKVTLLGDNHVGKDHLAKAFTGGVIIDLPFSNFLVDLNGMKRTVAGELRTFFLWTPSPRNEQVMRLYSQSAQIIFLIYNISDKVSFENLPKWLKRLRSWNQNCELFIIGNKLDLEKQREVSEEEARAFAEENNAHFMEVSAKEGTNLPELLEAVEKKIISMEEKKDEEKDESKSGDLTQADEPINEELEELRGYIDILEKLKDKEYFSNGSEKKAQAITTLLEKPITKEVLEAILKNEKDPLVKNRNILGSGFFRIKSKVLGHTNPLREGRACQSETEWKLVKMYNAFQVESVEDSESSLESSATHSKAN